MTRGPWTRLQSLAMVEREIDRARRAFGCSSRSSPSAVPPTTGARRHDAIARTVTGAGGQASPDFRGPIVKPLTYLGARLLAGDHTARRSAQPAPRRAQSVSLDSHPLGP